MSDPFLGQIVMFGGNFAPRGWALCDGQLLAISQYSALFSILGTTYGGDGRTTFALPDLRGRVSMHPGNGPGLSSRRLGERAGTEAHTLTLNQLPSHTHTLNATTAPGTRSSPSDALLSTYGTSAPPSGPYSAGTTTDTTMHPGAVGNTGSGQSVSNIQPYQCVNYIIALQGVFPSRN